MKTKGNTALLNFESDLDIRGDIRGKKMFIVTFLCLDQDKNASAYSKIYRADGKKHCNEFSNLDAGTDEFGNITKVYATIDVGFLR